MSSVKRKAVTEERPNKKSRSSDAAEVKRADKKSDKPAKSRKSAGEDGERKAPIKSILQQEEKAFPRGGGSVLTPIEQKQIRVQAEQDVLFEQQTGQKAPAREDEDGALFDEETEAAPAGKKHKSKKHAKDAAAKVPGSGIRIQGLSYKNLVVGSQVLGYVTAITSKDIALALANNLTGYVPITAISQLLKERIEKLLSEDEMKDDADDEDIDLKSLFHIGQWLRATVISTGSDAGEGKSKRHIELSIDPMSVNGGLEADNVVVNSMLQASVRSVEDHGLVMDLGLSSADVKGFVSKKELGIGYELDKMQEGQVLMCLVTGKGSNGKVLKLSPDALRFSALVVDKAPVVSEAPTVEAFLPGTAVQILVTETGAGGVAGKVMGMVETTADLVHSGAGAKDVDMSKKFKVGSKVKGRIIWTLPNDDGSRRVGVSMLDTMLALPPPTAKLPENASPKQKLHAAEVSQRIALSSIVADATVTQVLPERGVFLSFSSDGTALSAFAHISQISDKRIDVLTSASGPYKLGSTHKVRVISHNPVDNLYYVALKESVLLQTFLRLEDLTVGEVVSGTVDRLILGGKTGITGILVKLSEGVTGLAPDMHLSDVQLQHPERKFREGFPIKARVLSVDLEKRHVRLTLKKSLVNDDSGVAIWKDYDALQPGMEGKGTIVNLLPNGGVVQFFGNVRAWLPVAEMGEGFIQDPKQQFRLGQTVNVRIVSVTPETQEMKVSCKSDDPFDEAQQSIWDGLSGCDLVNGTVTVKGGESVELDLDNGLRGILKLGHLADGESSKAESALKRIRVGQKLTDLLVLNKLQRSHQVLLSNKPSLLKATKDKTLLKSFEDVVEGAVVHGFARNITPEGIYVEYADGLVGLVPKSLVHPDLVGKPAFGLVENQSVRATVLGIDAVRERFTLTMREQSGVPVAKPAAATTASHSVIMGQVVKVKIASVRSTQLNVRLADGAQGRVDFSEIFDSWEDISNKKAPLQKFKPNEEIEVKVLGLHDAKNHRFLPISHRQSKAPVYELSAKPKRMQGNNEDLLSLDSVNTGSSQVVFVNNHGDNCIWVSLSPNVRGRIALMDLSDDVGMLQKLEKNFPVGSALRVQVKSVDVATGRLDFTATSGQASTPVALSELSPGMVLPGRVTKITERAVNVQLSDSLAGPVPLTELSDDFDQANPAQYNRNDIVRVCVLGVDASNKKVFLSLRPSKVLSSSLPVKDAQINNVTQLETGQLVRGFVKHVSDRGVIVSLSARVDAFVRISNLSDSYVKDWKTIVEVDQLVTGRILNVDTAAQNVQISLKASHVDKDYKPPLNISELEAGMIVTGKVRKVEDFGAFIDIDNTMPKLSGLCHRSEVASKRVEDVRKLYGEGDVVKAKILSVDVDKRKISLGLKASYFAEAVEDEEEGGEDDDDAMEGVELDADSDEGVELNVEGGVELGDVQGMDSDDEEAAQGIEVDDDEDIAEPTGGLKTAGFDWTGDALDNDKTATLSDSEPDTTAPKKKKRKAEIKVDMTGDLDKYGPQNASDFERQLLGQPNNSGLWIQYMAFQLQLSETQAARDLAERALRTIHIRESEEKGNIWIAWLNLEVEYGDDEKVDEVFKQACQVQDSLEMHEKLASILINSGKYGRAEDVFEKMVGNKTFRANGDMWLNYASFLMEKMKDPTRARSMLSRALQSVPANEHRLLTAKFAGLEFRSSEGDAERARTIFEGLVTEWSKWSGGWDMWVDLEQSRVTHAENEEAKEEAREKVQALFERMVKQKMKPRRAKFVFKRWLDFEEKHGDAKGKERVEGLARNFVEGLKKGEVDE